MDEIYISTDIEADGPIPGPYSMLSLGSAAFTADKQLLGTFSVNLETLPGATAHPEAAAWWATQPAAWAACRVDPQPPELAMERYVCVDRGIAGEACVRRAPRRLRLPVCILVFDSFRRTQPVRFLGARHQELCHGCDAQALPAQRQAQHAAILVRPNPAYPYCFG